MKFRYKAIKESRTISGVAEAANRDALIASFNRQGIHPVMIKAERGKSKLFDIGKSKKVRLSDLVVFTRQLSTMISAGVPLARSLSALQADSESPYLREVLSSVLRDVEGGLALGDAFTKFPNVFSEIYVNMVKAGENGGILDEILKRLAAQVEQDASIRKKIKGAMMYPSVILTVTVVAFFIIMLFIIPKINTILISLGGPNAQLPIYTRILLSISHFIQHNIIFILIAMVILVFGFLHYIRTPAGKYQFHAFLLRAPVVRTIVGKMAIARFARTFASLMSAGVTVLDALSVTAGAVGNRVIEEEIKVAAKEVKNGKQLSEAMSQSKHFPPIVRQMLAVGEETGQIDTVLIKVADFYEEEASTLIDGLAAIIEPIMIIFLGAAVGLLAASVMGPIAGLSKNVGNS